MDCRSRGTKNETVSPKKKRLLAGVVEVVGVVEVAEVAEVTAKDGTLGK